CEHGVEVVYVSNHGGRQLDHGRGAIEVLPEVVRAVEGRAKVWIDGGFSRGSDIVKAIALGASLVGIGRLYCYALTGAGGAGGAPHAGIFGNGIARGAGPPRRHPLRTARPLLRARGGTGRCAKRPQRLPAD